MEDQWFSQPLFCSLSGGLSLSMLIYVWHFSSAAWMTRWSPKETASVKPLRPFTWTRGQLLGPTSLVRALVTRAVHYYHLVLNIPTDITFVLVRCHVLRLELGCYFLDLFSNEIIRNEVFTFVNWNGSNMFEPNMDKKGSTLWLDVASGVLQTVENTNMWRDLWFPVTWRRQFRFPGAVFPFGSWTVVIT